MRIDQRQKLLKFPPELITRELLTEAHKIMYAAALLKTEETGVGVQRHAKHVTTTLSWVALRVGDILEKPEEERNLKEIVEGIESSLSELKTNVETVFLPVTAAGYDALTAFLCDRYDAYAKQRTR
jgi:hypothetical protein